MTAAARCMPVRPGEDMVRYLVLAAAVAVLAVAAPRSPVARARRRRPVTRDPRTAAALLKVATVFNDGYDDGDYGPVYDRWDARSQAIIGRADYIRRHAECPVIAAARAGGGRGSWPGRGVAGALPDQRGRLTDYWFYAGGRWVFDLVLSNPDAVKRYKLPPRQYAAAAGCAH